MQDICRQRAKILIHGAFATGEESMSDVTFNCPHCGQALEAAAEDILGQIIECPCCTGRIQFSHPEPLVAPKPEPVRASPLPPHPPPSSQRIRQGAKKTLVIRKNHGQWEEGAHSRSRGQSATRKFAPAVFACIAAAACVFACVIAAKRGMLGFVRQVSTTPILKQAPPDDVPPSFPGLTWTVGNVVSCEEIHSLLTTTDMFSKKRKYARPENGYKLLVVPVSCKKAGTERGADIPISNVGFTVKLSNSSVSKCVAVCMGNMPLSGTTSFGAWFIPDKPGDEVSLTFAGSVGAVTFENIGTITLAFSLPQDCTSFELLYSNRVIAVVQTPLQIGMRTTVRR